MSTEKIIKLDTPNKNGRIYSTEALEKAIAEWNSNGKPLLGTIGNFVGDSIDVSAVAFVTENLRIEDGHVVGDVKILKTPNGEMLNQLVTNDVKMAYRSVGYCGNLVKTDNGVEVQDFTFTAIAAIPEEDAA